MGEKDLIVQGRPLRHWKKLTAMDHDGKTWRECAESQKVQRVLFAVVICVMDALSTSSKSSPKSSRMSVHCLDINIIFNSFLLDVTQHLQMYCHL